MKKADFILVAFILIASLAGFFLLRSSAETYFLEIIFDGQRIHYEQITPTTNDRLVIEEIGEVVIVIEEGVVDVVSATENPNQICVYASTISQDSWNPTIICAPNKLTIRIIGGAPIVDVII
jgi:hypothetical protein